MNIVVKDDDFKKTYKRYHVEIDKTFRNLKNRLEAYREKGVTADRIFNDEKTIHGIINKKYYVYGDRLKTVKVRVLFVVDGEDIIVLSTYIKNRNNNMSNTDYLKQFNSIVSKLS